MAYRTYTTHPAADQVKKVCPAPPKAAGETPAQRKARLMSQAGKNRLRVKELGEGAYQVPSQRKGPDGRPLTLYLVREFVGLGWACNCPWQDGDAARGVPGRGLYVPGENDIALCAHVAQVLKRLERQEREIARFTARLVARMEAQQDTDPTPYVPTEGPLAANHYKVLADAGTAALSTAARADAAYFDLIGEAR
jgi:hypothetical protein